MQVTDYVHKKKQLTRMRDATQLLLLVTALFSVYIAFHTVTNQNTISHAQEVCNERTK